MRHRQAFMGVTRSCRFRKAIVLIGPSVCMQQPSVPTSRWRTFIRGNSVCRQPDFDFSPCTGVGAAGYGDLQIHEGIIAGEPIDVYNHGDMRRDFTYIDDIVNGVVTVLDRVPAKDAGGVPHQIYNLGNHRSESLLRFIEVLSAALGRKAEMRLLPMQLGDVKETFADIARLSHDYGWAPTTTIDVGLLAS